MGLSSSPLQLQECLQQAERYDMLERPQREQLCERVTELLESPKNGLEVTETRPSRPIVKQIEPCLEQVPGYDVIGIDFETNGVRGLARYEVVEIGAMHFTSGSVFHSLINPGADVKWSKEAESVHGISKEMVTNEDVLDWSEVWKEFVNWVQSEQKEQNVVLVAHNGMSFDFRIIMRNCKFDVDASWTFFDSLIYARNLSKRGFLEGPHKLESLRTTLNITSYGRAHQADSDIMDLGRVLKELLRLDGAHTSAQMGKIIHGDDNEWCGDYEKLRFKLNKAPKNNKTAQTPKQGAASVRKTKPKKSIVNTDEELKKEVRHVMREPYDGRLSMLLCEDLEKVKLYTPALLTKLRTSGFSTLLHILKHLPREYVALTDPHTLDAGKEETVMFKGNVLSAQKQKTFRVHVVEWALHIPHETCPLDLRCTQFWGTSYRGHFAATKYLENFPVGTEAVVVGKVKFYDPESKSVELVPHRIVSATELGQSPVLPIYPDKLKIKSNTFPDIITKAIEGLEPLSSLNVYPPSMTNKYASSGWIKALFALHRPQSMEAMEKAKFVINFHDLVCMHTLLKCKSAQKAATEERTFAITDVGMVGVLRSAFKHSLTDDQETCLSEILEDVASETPMLRILQGDVGTGKTIVAFMTMFATYGSGYQSTMLVPTEILGQQHYRTLQDLILKCPESSRPHAALLTASTKRAERTKMLADLANGDIDMLIGTHALFNKDVQFDELGLVIVDEQHKFGVEQRQKVKQSSGILPHMLMMSATPIPRTMALAVHGTMSISSIKTQLPGKKEVATHIVCDSDTAAVDDMFRYVTNDIQSGGRVYIVFPCIEESEVESFAHLKSVEKEFEVLSKTRFEGFKCGLVHGRLPSQEKADAFVKFANGETDVLMSTTVIEVGMDVQEASVMIVYHPERFGLAQLHQLRGRVGRGKKESVCFLVPPDHVERLAIFQSSSNGEEIAWADLRNRGPGELVGSKQSGFKTCMTFPWTSILSNTDLLAKSHEAAAEFLDLCGGEIPKPFAEMMKVQGFPALNEFEL